jgi:hypothetical protein
MDAASCDVRTAMAKPVSGACGRFERQAFYRDARLALADEHEIAGT